MTNKIENTSNNKEDYIRRDFSSKTNNDRYGNKSTKDEAGNIVSIHKDEEDKDFSYQKKYNLMSRNDTEGGNYVDVSVMDDAFVDNLVEKTKSLISSGKRMNIKHLPKDDEDNMRYEVDEKEIDIDTITSLQKIVDTYIGNTVEEREEKTIKEITSSLKIKHNNEINEKLCYHCNKIISEDAKFCQFCGIPVELKCQKCNHIILDEANYCPQCGEKISK